MITEHEFRARVRAWAGAFSASDRREAALFQPDAPEFAAALLGAWLAGLAVHLPGDVLPATCRALARQGVVFAGDFPPELAPVTAPPVADTAAPFATLEPEFVGVVVRTSGTTGEPQALPKTLAQLGAEVEMLDRQFGHSLDGAVVVSTVSHQHIYGLLFKVLWPLSTRRVFLAETLPYPEQLAERLGRCRSALVSGPAHLKRLPDSLDWTAARTLTAAVFSSGGPLASDASALAERLLGSAPIEVYGSSETGGIAWRQRPGGAERPWAPLPGVDVRTDGRVLSVRSPQCAGSDWFETADLAEILPGGTFTLSGRADRVAKIEGKRVSLAAVERALTASPLVNDARTVPLDGDRDALGAVVVPSAAGWDVLRGEGAAALGRRLREGMSDAVERVAMPRRWRWVDTLPQDAQGKVTAAGLSRLFRDGESRVPPFRVLERGVARAVVELQPSRDLECFDGHFARTPVLAGVVQVDWAVELGRTLFGVAGDFRRLDALKFPHVFQPGPALRVELEWRAAPASLHFRFSSGSGVHSSGRIFFTS